MAKTYNYHIETINTKHCDDADCKAKVEEILNTYGSLGYRLVEFHEHQSEPIWFFMLVLEEEKVTV